MGQFSLRDPGRLFFNLKPIIMYNPEIKTQNIMLSAKYGYRFLPVNRITHSEKERKALKRMKKYVTNNSPFNSKNIIRLHTLDEHKLKHYE